MSQALLANVRLCNSPAATRRLAFASGEKLLIKPDAPRTLIEALLETARLHPQRGMRLVGVRGEKTLPYSELLKNALRVAAGLRQNGLQAGDHVILQLDTLWAHYTAFWGCLLAGVAPVAVALAPTYKERNAIVSKLHNTWQLLRQPPIITSTSLASSMKDLANLTAMGNLRLVCIEDLMEAKPLHSPHLAAPADVAFLQLSSGSTGIPKCIQETHRGILSHIYAAQIFNRYEKQEVTLNWLPVDHVVPILTFHLRDVCLGYEQIQVQPELVLSEPLAWLDLIQAHRVTQTWAPNFAFKLVSDRLSRATDRSWNLSSVKFFMNAGEQVTLPVLRDFLERVAPFGVHQSAMQPAFGMAEVCTCMTYANHFNVQTGAKRFLKASLDHILEPAGLSNGESVEFVSLGRPVPGVSIRITDSSNRIVPEGVIGRLHIKGAVVTPGYLNNPEANAEAFVGGGWFNSGDLGFIQNGELFVTGREKEMIIVRGAKFYCYEIEDVVNQVQGVEPTFAAACSIADASAGTEQLAVFFVPNKSGDPLQTVQEIRQAVSARLGISPRYVLPLPRQQFPKTTSGKIQRTYLKKTLESGACDPLVQQVEHALSAPGSPGPLSSTEKRIAGLWEEVLGCPVSNIDRSLFACGGDSLKAIQIVSRLRELFRREFPLANLFEEDATVRRMAAWVDAAGDNGHRPALPPITCRARDGNTPASSSQLRIWLADQIQPGAALFNISRTLQLSGPLDRNALEQAVRGIIDRHEILRTVFRFDGTLKQQVRPVPPRLLKIEEMSLAQGPQRDVLLKERVTAEANRPFDLANDSPFRATLLILGETEHLLMLTFHQIVIDGWSIPIFYRELATLYQASLEHQATPLPPLPIQYGDFALWQRQWITDDHLSQQFDYWKNHPAFSEPEIRFLRPEVTVPAETSCTRASRQTQATVKALTLDHALVESMREFNAREGNTLFITLLTVYKLLLYRWSGQESIVVASPAAGRTRLETEGLIGFFVNTLLLRTQVANSLTFRELARRVRATASAAFAHSDAPFERLIQSSERSPRELHRWFQFWFAPIDPQLPFSLGRVQATPGIIFPVEAQADLSLFVSELPGELLCYFEFQPAILNRARIDLFIADYKSLLCEAIAAPDAPLASMQANGRPPQPK